MSDPLLRGNVPERGGEGFLTHTAEAALRAERDRFWAALDRIAGAGHSNQEKACKICVQIAEMALEGPADA